LVDLKLGTIIVPKKWQHPLNFNQFRRKFDCWLKSDHIMLSSFHPLSRWALSKLY